MGLRNSSALVAELLVVSHLMMVFRSGPVCALPRPLSGSRSSRFAASADVHADRFASSPATATAGAALVQAAGTDVFCDHVLVPKLSIAGRKEGARLLFLGFWVAGVVQSVLLAEGIGTSSGIRFGVGAILVLGAVYTGTRWALLSRQMRASRPSQH